MMNLLEGIDSFMVHFNNQLAKNRCIKGGEIWTINTTGVFLALLIGYQLH